MLDVAAVWRVNSDVAGLQVTRVFYTQQPCVANTEPCMYSFTTCHANMHAAHRQHRHTCSSYVPVVQAAVQIVVCRVKSQLYAGCPCWCSQRPCATDAAAVQSLAAGAVHSAASRCHPHHQAAEITHAALAAAARGAVLADSSARGRCCLLLSIC